MVPGGDLGRRPAKKPDPLADEGSMDPRDVLLGFQLEGTGIAGAAAERFRSGGIRGRMLRLGPAADTILSRHGYPEDVSRLLGEALAMATLLAETLAFDGVFTLQARGEGPVPLLVADYRKPGLLRGHASLDQERYRLLATGPGPSEPVPRLLGGGLLSFTVDQSGTGNERGRGRGGEGQRYQGIVELAGGTLADCANAYFQQSEQLDTVLRLAAGPVPAPGEGDCSRWRVGGILLQRLPRRASRPGGNVPAEGDWTDRWEEDRDEEDAWRRALTLLGSARDGELLDPGLSAEALLYRLFHEDGVRVFEPQPVAAHCTCSRARILGVLRTFSREEQAEMVVDGRVTVTCEFCSSAYAFDPGELAQGSD